MAPGDAFFSPPPTPGNSTIPKGNVPSLILRGKFNSLLLPPPTSAGSHLSPGTPCPLLPRCLLPSHPSGSFLGWNFPEFCEFLPQTLQEGGREDQGPKWQNRVSVYIEIEIFWLSTYQHQLFIFFFGGGGLFCIFVVLFPVSLHSWGTSVSRSCGHFSAFFWYLPLKELLTSPCFLFYFVSFFNSSTISFPPKPGEREVRTQCWEGGDGRAAAEPASNQRVSLLCLHPWPTSRPAASPWISRFLSWKRRGRSGQPRARGWGGDGAATNRGHPPAGKRQPCHDLFLVYFGFFWFFFPCFIPILCGAGWGR